MGSPGYAGQREGGGEERGHPWHRKALERHIVENTLLVHENEIAICVNTTNWV